MGSNFYCPLCCEIVYMNEIEIWTVKAKCQRCQEVKEDVFEDNHICVKCYVEENKDYLTNDFFCIRTEISGCDTSYSLQYPSTIIKKGEAKCWEGLGLEQFAIFVRNNYLVLENPNVKK